MNYRHAFHAGNFADVFKHVLLTRILVYLMRKDAPLRFIDSHAGRGAYDLTADEANRTGEWREGVGRVLAARADGAIPAAVAELLAPWLGVLDAINDGEGREATSYPGSPLLAARLLRAGDRLSLCELHPQDNAALTTLLRRDRRVRIAAMDGYAALNAWLPPVERRGLVHIDPPFEDRAEFERLTQAMTRAMRKWPTGCYAIWCPAKNADALDALEETLALLAPARALRLDFAVAAPRPEGALVACTMFTVNAPWTLADEARAMLPFLTSLLAVGEGASWAVRECRAPA